MATALGGLFAIPGIAFADESAPPRAVPAARALPRSFASYDELIAYASAVSADQTALDQRASDTSAALNDLVARVNALAQRSAGRGGALRDLEQESAERASRIEASRESAQIVALWQTLKQLNAAGALTVPSTPWGMPTQGEITQHFGPTDLWVEPGRTYDGVAYAHFHDGVDIACAWAAPVFAPARGRVVFVGRMMDGAEVVVLAHDGGVVTMYAHLDAWSSPPPVQAGAEVAAGQRIGTVGLTGITSGMHLHWAAYRKGVAIDPLSLIAD